MGVSDRSAVLCFALSALGLAFFSWPSIAQNAAQEPPALAADAFINKGDCASAIPLLRKAVAARPDDYVSTSRLGNCLLQAGQNDEALTWTKRALEFPQERANRLVDLAVLYTRLGDRDRAIDALAHAVDATGATYRMAADNLRQNKDFAPLHGDPRFEAILARAYGPGYEPESQRGFSPAKVKQGVDLLTQTIFKYSPNPYRYFTPQQWLTRAAAIVSRADELDAASYFFELVSLVGMNGDIHTSIFPVRDSAFLNRSLPLRFFHFSDGLYIRAAAPAHAHLVGAKVLRVGSFDVERGWDELLTRFPQENAAASSANMGFYLLFPEFARSQGWIRTDAEVPLTVRLKNGNVITASVRPAENGSFFGPQESATWLRKVDGFVDAAPWSKPPLWMTNRDKKYWYAPVSGRSAIYFAFNEPRDDENVVYEDFVLDLVRAIREKKAHRLIIDVRNNPGGWGYMAGDLVHAILGDPELNKPGRLVVLTSRSTASAGVIIAAMLERHTNAIFMGEPTSDAPNSFNAPVGNHVSWAVPGAPILFRYSSLVQQESDPLDRRNSIYPDVPIWMSFADYAAGRDPVLERALSITDEEAASFLKDPGGRPYPWYAHWRRVSQAPAFPNGQLPRRYY